MSSLKPSRSLKVKPKSVAPHRILLFLICVALAASLITYRLFQLAIVQHPLFVKSAQSQYSNPSALLAGRGSIYSTFIGGSERRLLAGNHKSLYVYADTKEIEDPQVTFEALAPILNTDPIELKQKLSQAEKTYQVLAKNIT